VLGKILHGDSRQTRFTHLTRYHLQKLIGRGRLQNPHARETSQAHRSELQALWEKLKDWLCEAAYESQDVFDYGLSVRAKFDCALCAHGVNQLEADTQDFITFVQDITGVILQPTLCLDQGVAQLRLAGQKSFEAYQFEGKEVFRLDEKDATSAHTFLAQTLDLPRLVHVHPDRP